MRAQVLRILQAEIVQQGSLVEVQLVEEQVVKPVLEHWKGIVEMPWIFCVARIIEVLEMEIHKVLMQVPVPVV